MKKSFDTNMLSSVDKLYIHPLKYKTLVGRQAIIGKKNVKLNIVYIYGTHSSLERSWGIIQALSDYGNLYAPDMPGFGGMDSLYKIKQVASIDNLADFIIDYLEHQFDGQKYCLIGLSFGFVVITRALQKKPQLKNNVLSLVSLSGFSKYDEFKFSRIRHFGYLQGSRFFDHYLLSRFFEKIVLSNFVLSNFYLRTYNAKNKLIGSVMDYEKQVKFEVNLWHQNDVRTWLHTTREFLKLDNTKKKIDLNLLHVTAKNDNFFDYQKVINNFKLIFKQVDYDLVDFNSHSVSILANKSEAQTLIPKKLINLLNNGWQ